MSKELEKILEEFDKEFKSEDGRDFFNEAERISRVRIFLKISLKQALTSYTEELKKKIEGKRKESEKFVPFQKIHYQSALDDIITELNHQ